MGKMARDKGARGEREIKNLHNEFLDRIGFGSMQMRRNSFQTLDGGYDLVGLDFLAIEIKFQESFSLANWWEQTLRQTKPGQIPVLFYRKSRVPWRVRMSASVVTRSTNSTDMIIDIDIDSYFDWLGKYLQKA